MDGKYRFSDFSSQSVVRCVDSFVRSVDHMNETVMVPSRLLNVELSDKDQRVPELLRGSSDPYTFYTVLNNMRNNVVWGMSDNELNLDKQNTNEIINSRIWSSQYAEDTKNTSSGNIKIDKSESNRTHLRKISSTSQISVASSTNSECSSRLSDTADSGVDSEEVEPVVEITASLKAHMRGMQSCLSRLSDTAQYITELYQEEVKV